MTAILHDEATRRAVEGFLFREARLLDDHEYGAWFDLWTSEARYWVPSNRADIDPDHEVSLIYDDYAQLADRVFRITHPAAHAYEGRPRLARVISNIEVSVLPDEVLEVRSSYVLVANRGGETAVYGARVSHTLIDDDDGHKMTRKKVVLTANDDALRNLTFLP